MHTSDPNTTWRTTQAPGINPLRLLKSLLSRRCRGCSPVHPTSKAQHKLSVLPPCVHATLSPTCPHKATRKLTCNHGECQRLLGGVEGTPVSQLDSPLSRMLRVRGRPHLLLVTPPAKRAHHSNRLAHAISTSPHMTQLLAFAPDLFSAECRDWPVPMSMGTQPAGSTVKVSPRH